MNKDNLKNEDMKESGKPDLGAGGAKPEKKVVTIYVNSTPVEVEKDDISYSDVVTHAFPEYPQHPERTYSVTYERGHGEKPEGILSPGGTVKVKNQMRFNVKFTGQS